MSAPDVSPNLGKSTAQEAFGQTAQSTGACGYMCHPEAKEFAEIYHTQEECDIAQHPSGVRRNS